MAVTDIVAVEERWILVLTYYKPEGDASDVRSLVTPVTSVLEDDLFGEEGQSLKTSILNTMNVYPPAEDELYGSIAIHKGIGLDFTIE